MLQLRGDLDMASADELRLQLLQAVQDVGAGEVILDMSGVTFMDATALGMLVGANHRLTQLGGNLKIESPPDHVRRLLAAAGLDGLLGP